MALLFTEQLLDGLQCLRNSSGTCHLEIDLGLVAVAQGKIHESHVAVGSWVCLPAAHIFIGKLRVVPCQRYARCIDE